MRYLLLVLMIVSVSSATTTTRFVKAPAGNGSLNGTSYANAYQSIYACEDGEDGAISSGDTLVILFHGKDTISTNFADWNSNVVVNIVVPDSVRHIGVFDSTKALMSPRGTWFQSSVSKVNIVGLQIKQNLNSYTPGLYSSNSNTVTINQCIFFCHGANSQYCINTEGGNSPIIKINNSLFYGGNSAFAVVGSSAGGTIYVENCTFAHLSIAVWNISGSITAKNVGFYANGTAVSGTVTQDKNFSTVPLFTDSTNFDYSLASGDVAWKDSGSTLTGDAGWFSSAIDIEGKSRSGSWDVGAYEYVQVGYPCDSNIIGKDTLKVWVDAISRSCSLYCDTGDIKFQWASDTAGTISSDSTINKDAPYLYKDTTGVIFPSTNYWTRFVFRADTGTAKDTTKWVMYKTRDSSDTSAYWLYSGTSPVIDSIRPTGGIFGTQITVRGHVFGAAPDGYINGALVPYTVRNDSTYTFTMTDIPERGNVPVVIKNNTYNTYDTIQFFIFYNPQLASVTPNHGRTSQGDTVEIRGDTLGAVDTVWFQNDPVIPFSVTDSLVKVEAPAHAPTTVYIAVHDTNGYKDTLQAAYEYNNLYGWTVTHPARLDTAGGDTIRFHSEYGQVTANTVFTFDGNVEALTSNTDTLSTYITPSHAKGIVPWSFDALGTVRTGTVRYGGNGQRRRSFGFLWGVFRF